MEVYIKNMKLQKRKPSGREKDEQALRLLEKLREQLYLSNVSVLRRSAFHLSWLQEDGLDILKEALFCSSSRKTKNAAAYGLRKMRGRMKKIAIDVLIEGQSHRDSSTATACKNALMILRQKKRPRKPRSNSKRRTPRFVINELPPRRGHRTQRPRVSNRPYNR